MPGSKDDYNDRDKSRRGDRDIKPLSSGVRDRSPLKFKKGGDKRVIVSNIPYEYRWQELKDLFRQEVGEVVYVELFTDDHEKSRGCGVIEFDSAETAQNAVEKMHRYELKGRKLVVKEDNNSERERYKQGGRSSGGGGGGGAGGGTGVIRWDQPAAPVSSTTPASKFGNTYGLSPAFLESLNINGPLITKVFVANLDYKVDEKKLREVFRLPGKVLSVDLTLDKDGKSRGFGTVEYEHPVEAVQAISMLHNQILYDRRINVRMDKSSEKPDGPPKLPDGLRAVGRGLGANGSPLTDVARNLPSLNLSSIQPASGLGPGGNQSSALAALGTAALASLGQNQLGNKLLEMVVGNQLGGSSSNNDIGLRSNNLNSSFTSSLGPVTGSNASSGYLSGGNLPFAGGSVGNLPPRNFDSISALGGSSLGSSSIPYNDYDYNKTGSLLESNLSSIRAGMNHASDTVVVTNLPPAITWQRLRDYFQDAGESKYVELKNKDTGIIRFGNERDAERALSMFDRTRFDGRIINVAFY